MLRHRHHLRGSSTTPMAAAPLLLVPLLVALLSSCGAQDSCLVINKQQPPHELHFGFLGLESFWPSVTSVVQIAVNDVNDGGTILPGYTLVSQPYDTMFDPSLALADFISGVASTPAALAFIGPTTSSEAAVVGVASGTDVFNTAILSGSATSVTLEDSTTYPYFSRIVPPDSFQAKAMVDIVAHFHWNQTGCISTSDDYGVNGIKAFITNANARGIAVLTYQQFLPGATDIVVQMRELANSKARVFIAFMLDTDFRTVLTQGQDPATTVIGAHYVWICSDGCAISDIVDYAANNTLSPMLRQGARGLLGTTPTVAKGPRWDALLAHWRTLNQTQYPGINPFDGGITVLGQYYDCVTLLAKAFRSVLDAGLPFNGSTVTQAIRMQNFQGLTGQIAFINNTGDPIAIYDVLNFRNDSDTLATIGSWNSLSGLNFSMPPEFYDGTTTPPDLDVRPPFDYWSCFNEARYTDPTGKTIVLEEPDFGNPNNINASYICDNYIDCNNMSDEWNCSISYPIIFICFGILTGIMILIQALVFLPFTIIFAYIKKSTAVHRSSPHSLIVMNIACIIGYGSTYAWYGKPQEVACNFQSWLLGTAAALLIGSLLIRSARLVYLFYRLNPNKEQGGPDMCAPHFMILALTLIIVPTWIFLGVWTLVSTPTAELQYVRSKNHWVCQTGGFTGSPGGYVFFFVLVGALGALLVLGLMLSYLARKVSSRKYMDARVVPLAIFNLFFTCAIGIPVYFVLRFTVPVADWIIRTLVILYGFGATSSLQFFPLMWRVIVTDRFATKEVHSTSGMGYSGSGSGSASGSDSTTMSGAG